MSWSQKLIDVTKSPTRRLFARNLAVLTAGELISRILTAIAFIHLARVLSPTIYGLVEVALAILMILTLVVDQGFPTLGTRDVARNHSAVTRLVRRIISTQLILAVGVFTLSLLLIVSISIDRTLTLLLIGYALTLLIYPFLISWVFQGRNQMEWVAIPLAIRQAIFAIMVLLIVRSPEDVLLLPLTEIVAITAASILTLIAFIRSGGRISINFRGGWDQKLFVEALPIGGSQLIWAVRMFLPTIIVGAITDPISVGLFGASHRIVMTIQTMLAVYFKNLLPSMSQVAAFSADRLSDLLRRSLLPLLLLSTALALTTTLGAPIIIRVIYGADYFQRDAIVVLGLLIWIIPLLAWRRHSHYALLTMGHQREDLFFSAFGVILLLALIFPLTSFQGAIGASLSMVISEMVASILIWWRVRYHLKNPVWINNLGDFSLTKKARIQTADTTTTAYQEKPDNEPEPIFIVGAPRSGTTLLQVLLNRHPSIGICSETYFFYYVYDRRSVFGDLSDIEARQHLVTQYLATNRIKRLGVDIEVLKKVLLEEGDDYDSFFLSLIRFHARENGKWRYGEKTPHHALHKDTLRKLYPTCKLIQIVRDPRDVVASLMRMPWASNNILTNTRTWLKCNVINDDLQNDKNFLLVFYEDLVNEPEKTMKQICGFLGEAYDSTIFQADENNLAYKWWFQRAHQPISKSRLGAWQQQLSPTQVALIENLAGPLLQKFGYERSNLVAPKAIRFIAMIGEFFSSIKDKLGNFPRLWYYWIQPTYLSKEEELIDNYP